MNYYLAIDGGGTKTQVLCADEAGQVVGEGISGPTSLAVINPGAASFNLREALRQATEKITGDAGFVIATMGLAGMDVESESQLARSIFGPVFEPYRVQKLVLVNDIVIALAGGSNSTNALALISGTGSNCYGRNQEGLSTKTGGMDFLLTDQGSGYAIGRAVLRQAVKSYDGRISKNLLEPFVCEHFRITSIAELKPRVYSPVLTKTEVAELAQVCLRAFDQGDAAARGIFDYAVTELFMMAKAVMDKLQLVQRPADCVLAGSVTKISYVQDQLRQKLLATAPQLNVVVPTEAPVHGALKLALQGGV